MPFNRQDHQRLAAEHGRGVVGAGHDAQLPRQRLARGSEDSPH